MKLLVKFTVFVLLIQGTIFISCRQEYSCEDCLKGNQPPIADAGRDTLIVLPVDSVKLNGSGSHDPDGTIASFQWTKITGPASFAIMHSSAVRSVAEQLVSGIYQFELKVTDNSGLSAKDTVQVIVSDPLHPNRPPVAKAGPDQVITLPVNAVNLDGTGSTDPDNNITNYVWTRISGPSSFIIPAAVQTTITNLTEGVYLVELKVTDAGGLFAADTMKVTVGPVVPANFCGSTRPQINAQLIPVGTLSQARPFMTAVSAGNKICFAGGSLWPYPPYASTRVDVFDVVTQAWSATELSAPRWQMATVAAGNKIFFAGGGYYDDGDNAISSDVVDIYDVAGNSWTATSLSESRFDIAAATVGNNVFFAGGIRDDNTITGISDKVDIYNVTTNSWSSASLSQARGRMTAVTVNDKIYFGGGMSGYNVTNNGNNIEMLASNRIDVYDNGTSAWSTASLSGPRYYMAGVAVADKIYWAGGYPSNPATTDRRSCLVEINNVVTQNNSTAHLFKPQEFYGNAGQNAVVKDNKIVFFTGGRYLFSSASNQFDIYDTITDTWSIGILPVSIENAAIISVNNTIYVAGGLVNGSLSNQVWKLQF